MNVDFQKNALIFYFQKMQKIFHVFHRLWLDISCIKFLKVSDFKAFSSNDTKEAGILDHYGLPLNGG